MSASAIIVAAGSSRRAGFDKMLAPLCGVSVLRRSMEAFCACPEVDELIVVCSEERFVHVSQGTEAWHARVKRVDGGSERHESVLNGLQALSTESDIVLVHDGARPLVTQELIARCIAAAREHGAASAAHPVVDTLKRGDADGRSLATQIDRAHLWAMETPQAFDVVLLKQAYDEVLKQGAVVTDEVSAVELLGKATYFVANEQPNMKITMPGDIVIAEVLWKSFHQELG